MCYVLRHMKRKCFNALLVFYRSQTIQYAYQAQHLNNLLKAVIESTYDIIELVNIEYFMRPLTPE